MLLTIRRCAGSPPDGDLRGLSPYCAELADGDHRAQLIGGSGTAFITAKLTPSCRTATEVKWHQDFLFTPHSNDDIITALLMVSEVTPENGRSTWCRAVIRAAVVPLAGGRFTGAVDDEVVATHCQQPQACFGPAGSVCFMHTRLLRLQPQRDRPAAHPVHQRLRRGGCATLRRKPAAEPPCRPTGRGRRERSGAQHQ